MSTFKIILCPIDFSEASFEGLKKAAQLSPDGSTEIYLLHVMPKAIDLMDSMPSDSVLNAEAVNNMSDVLAAYVPPHVRTKPLFKRGEAAEQIVRTANEEKADLIVLTTHGATGFRAGELGSVAEAVLQNAQCPVLVLNGPTSRKRVRDAGETDAVLQSRDASMRPAFEVVHSTEHALFLDGD